jgi:hypothetical protein
MALVRRPGRARARQRRPVIVVGTMLQSQRSGAGVWKSSVLAPLFARDGRARGRELLMQG